MLIALAVVAVILVVVLIVLITSDGGSKKNSPKVIPNLHSRTRHIMLNLAVI